MQEIQLREYQEKFNAEILRKLDAGKKVCGVAPCGAGKTVMAADMVKNAVNRGERVVFMVHRKELIEQTADTFKKFDIPFGLILSGEAKNYELPVQIASVPTLVKRLDKVPAPDFLICDECHHILAKTYMDIIDKWQDARLLGITATPVRYGGIRLGDVFDSIVETPCTKELIQMGYLTKFKCYSAGINLHLEQIKVERGDYAQRALNQLMSTGRILGNIVQHYKKHAAGTQAICYCVNVSHSKKVANTFLAHGIVAAQVDGTTKKDLRKSLIEDFRLGKIQILCNAELFGEGFDVPNVHTVILARPTLSLTLFIQQAMRCLRPDPADPDKVAVILDHAQNIGRFGLPDKWRKWSLAPNKEKESNSSASDRENDASENKICPNCDAIIPSAVAVCPDCGYEFFKEADVELIEVKREPNIWIERMNEWKGIAKARHYKEGWIFYQVLGTVKSFEDCLEAVKIQKDLETPFINIYGDNENTAKWLWRKAQQEHPRLRN